MLNSKHKMFHKTAISSSMFTTKFLLMIIFSSWITYDDKYIEYVNCLIVIINSLAYV